MTVLDPTLAPARLRPVVLDLYRNVHKGIRSELFTVITDLGRLDPADDCGISALSEHVQSVAHLLEHHAETEDRHIGPVLEEVLPDLADQVAVDHERFERRFAGLTQLTEDVRTSADLRGDALHELYIELAAFTAAYLLHQDVEERVVNPSLESAIGVDAMIGVQGEIISQMAPQELIAGLAVMLPAMNVDERTEILGGMQASAPAPAFDAVWSLTGSVLSTSDHDAVARRLGLR